MINERLKKQIVASALVVLLLAVSAFFMSNVEMPPWASYVSGLNVILFAMPAFWATRWWLGWRDALILWAILGITALAIETSAIITGFPYGHFGYSELLGFKLFGYTPWTVALAWTPLVIGAYAVAAGLIGKQISAISDRRSALRIVLTAVLLVMFDVVLDPGAVKLGFWRYADASGFYGVPLSNFLGWLLSGAIGAAAIDVLARIRRPLLPVPAQLTSSAFFIISFWTFIAVFSSLVWAAAIGFVVAAMLAAFYFQYRYDFDDMIVYCDEQGTPTGTAPKLAAHDAETLRHLAFSVFIFNSKGDLLLQQRALTKKTWPGVWSNSCCGHVMLHETTLAAAKRRLRYELGLKVRDLTLALPDFRYRAEKDGVVENEICPVFVGFSDETPRPNPDEVNDIRWVKWEDFVIEVADPANGYSPWAREEVQLLAARSAEDGDDVEKVPVFCVGREK